MAAKKTSSVPRFGVDPGQFGTLLLGQRFRRDLTVEEVKAIHETTATWRTKSELPLVFVSPGPAGEDDANAAGDCFYAGVLLASAKEGGKPVTVDKSLLDLTAAARIPQGYWAALESEHGLALDPEEELDEEEGPPTGVFLAPAGWAVATLFLGSTDDEYLLTTSSEDSSVGLRLSEAKLAEIVKSKKPLKLVGAYC
jgi:hypothetical protein